MFKIIINNEEIDGFDSDQMVLNVILFNFADLSLRGNGYSNAIMLYKTGQNTNVFDLYNKDIYRLKYDVKIYWKSALVLSGYSKVITIQEKQFKIQIVGYKKDFFDKLELNKLMDLDLISNDFTYDSNNYLLLIENNTTLWDWCLVDGRNYEDGSLLDGALIEPGTPSLEVDSNLPILTYSRPSLRYKYIIDKIITEAGYHGDYSYISDIHLDDLRIGAFAEKFYFTDLSLRSLSSIVVLENVAINMKSLRSLIYNKNFFDMANDIVNQFENEDIVLKKTKSRLGIKITINIPSAKLIIKTRKGLIDEIIEEELNVFEEHIIENYEATILTDFIELENKDDEEIYGYAAVRFEFDRDLIIEDIKIFGLTDENDYRTRAQNEAWADNYKYWDDGFSTNKNYWVKQDEGGIRYPLLWGYYISSCFNLPDWSQKELFLEFIKLFNLDYEVINNKVVFKHRIVSAKSLATIITKMSNEPEKDSFVDVAKYNYFTYTNDDSLQSTEFRKSLYFDNELLSNEATLLQSLFSGSRDVLRRKLGFPISYYRIISIPCFSYTDRKQLSVRIYYVCSDLALHTNVKRKGFFIYQNSNSVKNSYTLDMSYLFATFYKNNFNITEEFTMFTYNVYLTYYDFLKIIENKIIYDNKIGKYFEVLEINKFNPKSLTELKCIGIK